MDQENKLIWRMCLKYCQTLLQIVQLIYLKQMTFITLYRSCLIVCVGHFAHFCHKYKHFLRKQRRNVFMRRLVYLQKITVHICMYTYGCLTIFLQCFHLILFLLYYPSVQHFERHLMSFNCAMKMTWLDNRETRKRCPLRHSILIHNPRIFVLLVSSVFGAMCNLT